MNQFYKKWKTQKISVFLFTAIATLSSCNTTKENHFYPSEKVEELVQKMSLEEKIGQMTQLNATLFYKDGKLSEEAIEKYIGDYHIGSVLNTPTGSAISIDQWRKFIIKLQEKALKSGARIPILYGIDAIHGATYTSNSTLFPHNIGLAATRDTALVYNSAVYTAQEVKASGIPWNFDPVLGVGRQPLWPRFEETYGEDTYLVKTLGCATLHGYQKNKIDSVGVIGCVKHFYGYSMPMTGKDRTPAYIPKIVQEEIFLPPFKAAIETGTPTVMLNSGSINGEPIHCNKEIITDLLKHQWGFQGFVVTDWKDIIYLYTDHKVAKNNKEAVKMAINAGVDMSMVPLDMTFYDDLLELVKNGDVSMSRINDAVARILTVKMKAGLFEHPYPNKELPNQRNKEHGKKLAFNAAKESITLLKNKDSILPFSSNAKVLVAGPCANALSSLHGSWSYVWEGNQEILYPKSACTIQTALKNIGGDNVKGISPRGYKKMNDQDIYELQLNAKNKDYIVLCLGEDSYAESEGNINDLSISNDQFHYAQEAHKLGKPIIVVLTEGRPRVLGKIADWASAIVMAYRPASQGANAIAKVLYGEINPSGILPFSYPQYTGDFTSYDAPVRAEKYYHPQWAFGYGQSYTQFDIQDMKLASSHVSHTDSVTVTVTIKNVGNRDGECPIDLYVKDEVASIAPPIRKLRAFQRVFIKAKEEKRIRFQLTPKDFSFVNKNHEWTLEPGDFKIILKTLTNENRTENESIQKITIE